MKAVSSIQPLQSRAVSTLHPQQASKHASNVTLLSKLFILVSAVGKASAQGPRQLQPSQSDLPNAGEECPDRGLRP